MVPGTAFRRREGARLPAAVPGTAFRRREGARLPAAVPGTAFEDRAHEARALPRRDARRRRDARARRPPRDSPGLVRPPRGRLRARARRDRDRLARPPARLSRRIRAALAFEHALSRQPEQPTRPPELVRIEREITLGSTSAGHLHTRLLPLLREAAEARLGPRPTREQLGDEAWELLRPDRPEPGDRNAPGISLRRVRSIVDHAGAALMELTEVRDRASTILERGRTLGRRQARRARADTRRPSSATGTCCSRTIPASRRR